MAVRRMIYRFMGGLWLGLGLMACGLAAEPSYIREVQPILRKYCGGCHNEADKEGDFSVASYGSLLKGTPDGKVIKDGDAAGSQLLQLIQGKVRAQMPPIEEAQPSEREIAILEKWIAAGAKNDAHMIPLEEQISTPALRSDDSAATYATGLIDANEKWIAVARLGKCELRDRNSWQVVSEFPVPGKINQLRVSPSGKYLLIAGGIAGVGGQVVIVDLATRQPVATVQGHTDAIYCAAMSPDDQWLCTGSYDRQAILWNWREQKTIRQFFGPQRRHLRFRY